MEVRKYRAKDRENLIDLRKTAFPDDPPHNEPSKVIDAKLKVDDQIYVVEDNASIIGACIAGYDGHRGWLYAVAVSPEHRRNGIGEQLISAAEKGLEELGCIKVNLQIRSTNSAVRAFYDSIGYATEERISMGKKLGKMRNKSGLSPLVGTAQKARCPNPRLSATESRGNAYS